MSKKLLGSLLLAGACSLAPLSTPSMAQQPNPAQQGGIQGAGAPMTQRTEVPGPAAAGTPAPTEETTARVDDKKFLKEVAEGNMAEVELGKLAAQKSTTPEVKNFAQKLVDDHSKSGEQLQQIAAKQDVQLPAASKPGSKIEKMNKLSGESFDKAFLKQAVKDHKNDIQMFQAEAQSGTDPAVKQFASETLPTLQKHLEIAKNLERNASSEAKR